MRTGAPDCGKRIKRIRTRLSALTPTVARKHPTNGCSGIASLVLLLYSGPTTAPMTPPERTMAIAVLRCSAGTKSTAEKR